MSRLLGLAVAGMIVFLAHNARAADPIGLPPPVIERSPGFMEESRSGWYLRGDVGYRLNNLDNVVATITPDPLNSEIDKSFTFGGGAGYKSGWFRTDVTIDYGPDMKYSGDTAGRVGAYTATFDSLSALLNVYFDLGTWQGFTPYVGAGLGGTHLRASDFTGVTAGDGTWNFTWALAAGASYDVAPNLAVDLGYRYVNFGDVVAGPDTFNNRFTAKELAAHEFRVGMRWSIN